MSKDDEELDPDWVEWCDQFNDYVTEDAEIVLLALGTELQEWLIRSWIKQPGRDFILGRPDREYAPVNEQYARWHKMLQDPTLQQRAEIVMRATVALAGGFQINNLLRLGVMCWFQRQLTRKAGNPGLSLIEGIFRHDKIQKILDRSGGKHIPKKIMTELNVSEKTAKNLKKRAVGGKRGK
jgi:hypothetical protein